MTRQCEPMDCKLREGGAIPRTGSAQHMALSAAMAGVRLPPEILKRLDEAFPAPGRRVPLDME